MIQEKKDIHCSNPSEHSYIFDILTEEEKERFLKRRQLISFRKGENLFKQGTPAASIYYIKEGVFKTVLEGQGGNLILNIVPNCNFAGLSVLGSEGFYPDSCVALTDAEVFAYETEVFKQVIRSNALFAAGIVNIQGGMAIEKNQRYYSLCQKQMHGRLADILLCLGRRVYRSASFELQLSRKDLGELSGMATESVIRILKDMDKEGIISVSGKKIEILNKERLMLLSKTG